MAGILDLLNSDLGKTIISGVSGSTGTDQDKTSSVLTMALPVLIVLGKSITAIQLEINYSGFIFLLLGSLSIIIVSVPIVVSYIIKAHLE